jgi:predicted lipid-binding transport protein (Tim44 family)
VTSSTHAAQARDASASRRRRRLALARVAGCLGSLAAGVALMGLALYLTDQAWARIAFLSGLLVGNGGVLLTLLVSYEHARRHGDR